MTDALTARILVMAVADMDDSLALLDMARRDFPHLTILARAQRRASLRSDGSRGSLIERETFEAPRRLGGHVLHALGYDADRVVRQVRNFREHTLKTLLAVYPPHRDQAYAISMARQGRQELQEMVAHDAHALQDEGGDHAGG